METIIQLIFLIALLKFCLKAAQSNSTLVIVGYGLSLALISFALYPLVITQPMTIIEDTLASTTMVANTALLSTAESILGVLVSVYLLGNYFKPKQKRTLWAKLLKISPGVIVVFAVAYLELLFFRWRVGGDFIVTSLMCSGVLMVGVIGVALGLRWLLDAESLRLELSLILNLIILVLGLLVSSSVAEYSVSNATMTVDWVALVSVLICFIAFALVGVWLHKINFSNKIKKLLRWNK